MDDWKPGDLALCVKDCSPDANPFGRWQPQQGGLYDVVRTGVGFHTRTRERGIPFLVFAQDPAVDRKGSGWRAACFTKIKPLTEDEEREARREIEQDQRLPVLAPGRHNVGYV